MAKKSKIKLPKRFLGIKVPRRVRKNVSSALYMLEHPDTRSLISAAVAALLVAGTEHLEHRTKAKRLARA